MGKPTKNTAFSVKGLRFGEIHGTLTAKGADTFMNLSYDTVKKITCGAARISEDDGFRFYRFTEKQEEVYRRHRSGLAEKTFSTYYGVTANLKNKNNRIIINSLKQFLEY